MSGSATSLPPEVAELMTQTCVWEAATSTDGYGQQTFAAPKTLSCWIEGRGTADGFEMQRGATDWTITPSITLFFDGDNPDAQSFTLNDRFTVTNYPVAESLQPTVVNPWYGPNYDNRTPWLISVTLSEK